MQTQSTLEFAESFAMDSVCPTFAAMAAPGSFPYPSCKPPCSTTHLSARSSSLIRLQFPIQRSSVRPSPLPRNFRLLSAAVSGTDASEVIAETEEGSGLKSNHAAPLNPSSFEVQSLLMEICDETSIAELELKMASFKLRVKRDVTKLNGSAAPVAPVAPATPIKPIQEQEPVAVPAHPSSATPNVPASLGALTLANSTQALGSRSRLFDAAGNDGLLFVTSPKVGYFRRSRVVKKKIGRPLCAEGQTVKEGQVVCYLEQLGTQQPVETISAGEVMKILCNDGDPVGYGDPLIAIRPSFAGIK